MDVQCTVVAAIALAILWLFEGAAPGLAGPGAGPGQRLRHIALGLLNGLGGILIVGLLFLADDWARHQGFGALRWLELRYWAQLLLGLVLLDLWQYSCHVLLHNVPVLWRFHAVHHHADKLEATVAMRFHTLETIVHALLTIPIAVVLGIGIEAVAAYNAMVMVASFFHHANIKLDRRLDRILRLVIVTPRMHWIHHSRWQPETDSNYGAILSIWDRLLGTMRWRPNPQTIDVGLDGFRPEQINTLRGMLATPFAPERAGPGERPDDRDLGRDLGATPGRD
jgi:sterol desaturase/sphingolipid hydroxylase (fatty acid hydroxylase superfamily)